MAAAVTTTTAPSAGPGSDHSAHHHHHASRPSWSLPTNLINIFNPFANPSDSDGDSIVPANPEANKDVSPRPNSLQRPILATIYPNANDRAPPTPTSSSNSIMFAEPDTRSTSDDGSREGSIDGRRRARKSARPKTQFSICHPPKEGSVRQKLHRRPRSLLQLHRLSANARPQPALEAVPSANFSVRLQKAVSRVFKAKHSLCPNDVVILKAEKYSGEEADEDREAQDVVGLICKGRKDDENAAGAKATIHLASGKVWEAYPYVQGGYEFFTTDEHGLGLTVRWVPKRSKEGLKAPRKRKFNFSTITPGKRQHPVIGQLTSVGLDIFDTYKMPDQRNASVPEDTADDDDTPPTGKEQCRTDDTLREIIVITSIWVTFKEGWSPSFRYDDKDAGPAGPASPGRPTSIDIATPPASPGFAALEKRSSLKSIGSGIIRRSSVLGGRSNRSSIQSIPERTEAQAPSRSNSVQPTGRARADSSSTVLVHRAASNRRKNNSQATWRPDLLAAQDTLPENSREDLSSQHGPSPTRTREASTWPEEAPRRQSVARPLIPDDTGSGADSSPSPPPPAEPGRLVVPRPRTPVDKPEHRESTSTSKTDISSGSEAARQVGAQGQSARTVKKTKTTTKKGSWRRKLLCH